MQGGVGRFAAVVVLLGCHGSVSSVYSIALFGLYGAVLMNVHGVMFLNFLMTIVACIVSVSHVPTVAVEVMWMNGNLSY